MKKKTPIKPTYFFDTPQGIDHFNKTLYENSDDPKFTKEVYQKMNRDTKVAMLKDEYSKLTIQNYNDLNSPTYKLSFLK